MKKVKRLLFFLIIVAVAAAGYITYSGYEKYTAATEKLSLSEAVAEARSIQNYTEYEKISRTLINAVVAVEDKRFFHHSGVDIFGTGRALLNALKTGKITEGGSSITQQLAKNLYFMSDNSPSRKTAEIFVAAELEKNYTKEEILELYLNVIYFGSGYYNVYDACKGYFGKTPEKISDYEATLLAGVPNAPSVYSPKKNPTLARKRQEKVVSSMRKNGYISAVEEKEILNNKR